MRTKSSAKAPAGIGNHLDLAIHRIEWRRRLIEIHDLDDAQIIVSADDAGDDADHGERHKARLHRRQEDEILGEEAGKRRNAGQRKHQHGKDESQALVGAGKPCKIGDFLDVAAVAAHGDDAGERRRG